MPQVKIAFPNGEEFGFSIPDVDELTPKSLILTSPSGKEFSIEVTDDGKLITTPIEPLTNT